MNKVFRSNHYLADPLPNSTAIEIFAVSAAGYESPPVFQHDRIFASEERRQLSYPVYSHDRRTSQPQELGWVKPRLKTIESLADKMTPRSGMQLCVIALGRDPVDLINIKKSDTALIFKRNATERLSRCRRLQVFQEGGDLAVQSASAVVFEAFAHPIYRFLETRRVDGFKQVIDCVYLKGLDRMFVKSRDENNVRMQVLFRQALNNRKPVADRHLNVEKDKIRIEPFDLRDGVTPIRGLADDLDVGRRPKLLPDAAARYRFVIDYQNPYFIRRFSHL